MPMFYIGSSSVSKVENGYRGSVSSAKYKMTWDYELKNNPQLFKTRIISRHETRVDALEKEAELQTKLNVVKNSMYINMSIAAGAFGIALCGKNNPMYGKKRPDSSERMLCDNPMFNEEVVQVVTQKKNELRKAGLHKSSRNSEESLSRLSERMKTNNPNSVKCCCLFCIKESVPSAITRHHKGCK